MLATIRSRRPDRAALVAAVLAACVTLVAATASMPRAALAEDAATGPPRAADATESAEPGRDVGWIQVVFEGGSIPWRVDARHAGRGGAPTLAVVARVAPARVRRGDSVGELRLPVAWRVEASSSDPVGAAAPRRTLEIDEALSGRLAAALEAVDVANTADAVVRERAATAGVTVTSFPADRLPSVLQHDAEPQLLSRERVGAGLRLLTRGATGTRWRVAESLVPTTVETDSPETPALVAPRQLPPGLPDVLIQVDVVALGLHLDGSSYALPTNALHATVRGRAWSLATGLRDWDHAVMVVAPLDPVGTDGRAALDDGGTAGDLLTRLVQAATHRLVSSAWPDPSAERALGLVSGEASLSERRAAALAARVARVAQADPTGRTEGSRQTSDEFPPADVADAAPASGRPGHVANDLLARLAAARLGAPSDADAWSALRQSVQESAPAHARTLLSVAGDPRSATAATIATRLGIDIEDATKRMERIPALGRIAARDIVAHLESATPEDPSVAATAALLLAASAGAPPEPSWRLAARPFLDRARAARPDPAGVATVLVAVRAWPAEAPALLEALLRAEGDGPHRVTDGPRAPAAQSGPSAPSAPSAPSGLVDPRRRARPLPTGGRQR